MALTIPFLPPAAPASPTIPKGSPDSFPTLNLGLPFPWWLGQPSALQPQALTASQPGPRTQWACRVGKGRVWPHLPKVPRYAFDPLDRALVDEALLGEHVLLPLLLRVQVHGIRCGWKGRALSSGSGRAHGPQRHGSQGAKTQGQVRVSEVLLSLNQKS